MIWLYQDNEIMEEKLMDEFDFFLPFNVCLIWMNELMNVNHALSISIFKRICEVPKYMASVGRQT